MRPKPEATPDRPSLFRDSPVLCVVAGAASAVGVSVVASEVIDFVQKAAHETSEIWAEVEPIVISPIGVAAGLYTASRFLRNNHASGEIRWKYWAKRLFVGIKDLVSVTSNDEK